jgi:hypothetical protein
MPKRRFGKLDDNAHVSIIPQNRRGGKISDCGAARIETLMASESKDAMLCSPQSLPPNFRFAADSTFREQQTPLAFKRPRALNVEGGSYEGQYQSF